MSDADKVRAGYERARIPPRRWSLTGSPAPTRPEGCPCLRRNVEAWRLARCAWRHL